MHLEDAPALKFCLAFAFIRLFFMTHKEKDICLDYLSVDRAR